MIPTKASFYKFPRLLLTAVLAAGMAAAQTARMQIHPPLEALSDSFEALAEKVTPAVVEVIASGLTPVRAAGTKQVTVGTNYASGVFVDAQGYIITNAHVVAGAKQIRVLVMLPTEGGRSVQGSILRPRGHLLDAKLLGYDMETDVAVLKVPVRTLRYVKFTDSDTVRKGQLVFAFGNPKGIEDAMTMGVVSSVARQLAPEDPMIYIQTDAAISAGLSGGPLVNIDGEMVGLNTFLRRRTSGVPAYGFAAPSNIVRAIYEQIRANGKVRRGFIGLTPQTITPEMAGALGLPVSQGVIVGDVLPMSPADQAGIEIGDIVLNLEGKMMENARQLTVNLYQRREGDTVGMTILRGKETRQVNIRVIERDNAPDRFSRLVGKRSFIPQLGILAVDVNQDVLSQMPFLRTMRGVLVVARTAGIPSGYDFEPGDVIHSVNGEPIQNLDELRAKLSGKQRGDTVVLQLERLGRIQYCTMQLQIGELH